MLADAEMDGYEHDLLMVYRLKNVLRFSIARQVGQAMEAAAKGRLSATAGAPPASINLPTGPTDRPSTYMKRGLGKYPDFEADKRNLAKLLVNYALEMQVKAMREMAEPIPVHKSISEGDEKRLRTVSKARRLSNSSDCGSEQENYSQILDSTISSLSGFSGASQQDDDSSLEMDLESNGSSGFGQHITQIMNSRAERAPYNQRLAEEEYSELVVCDIDKEEDEGTEKKEIEQFDQLTGEGKIYWYIEKRLMR